MSTVKSPTHFTALMAKWSTHFEEVLAQTKAIGKLLDHAQLGEKWEEYGLHETQGNAFNQAWENLKNDPALSATQKETLGTIGTHITQRNEAFSKVREIRLRVSTDMETYTKQLGKAVPEAVYDMLAHLDRFEQWALNPKYTAVLENELTTLKHMEQVIGTQLTPAGEVVAETVKVETVASKKKNKGFRWPWQKEKADVSPALAADGGGGKKPPKNPRAIATNEVSAASHTSHTGSTPHEGGKGGWIVGSALAAAGLIGAYFLARNDAEESKAPWEKRVQENNAPAQRGA